MVKKKEKKPKLRVKDPHTSAFIKVSKRYHNGLITEEQIDKELEKTFNYELSKFVRDMKEETKEIFYLAIITGAMFGVLSSAMINAMYRYVDNSSSINLLIMLGFIIAFFGSMTFATYELDRLIKKKVKSSIWFKIKKLFKK